MAQADDEAAVHRRFRLLPNESVSWVGKPVPGAPREPGWLLVPAVFFAFAFISTAFGVLLRMIGTEGGLLESGFVALWFTTLGIVIRLLPSWWLGGVEYALTDRRVLFRRGAYRRMLEVRQITYARIHWNAGAVGVGHLELVCAVPRGALLRRLRVMLYDVRDPDRVLARIRGLHPDAMPDSTLPLAERLDPDENVVWGGAPEGWLLGWREIAIGLLGALVSIAGILYAIKIGHILWTLELREGVMVTSPTWLLFATATGVSWALMEAVGAGLIYVGVFRSRELGRQTEYLLTDKRLLIRRGLKELSIDRRRIVDVADTPSGRDLRDLYLILDGPGARALADSGALAVLAPPRDALAPVLYEVRDAEVLKELILGRRPPSGEQDIREAA
ncbi:MAG: hypothetical protein IT379_20560 [Deltaproteobacteria bacterium]|nr:hypothetical protein [Deltaproteobacteria bacterium]